jgi:hypothetical protein
MEALSVHVVLRKGCESKIATEILEILTVLLKKEFGIDHTTIQALTLFGCVVSVQLLRRLLVFFCRGCTETLFFTAHSPPRSAIAA